MLAKLRLSCEKSGRAIRERAHFDWLRVESGVPKQVSDEGEQVFLSRDAFAGRLLSDRANGNRPCASPLDRTYHPSPEAAATRAEHRSVKLQQIGPGRSR